MTYGYMMPRLPRMARKVPDALSVREVTRLQDGTFVGKLWIVRAGTHLVYETPGLASMEQAMDLVQDRDLDRDRYIAEVDAWLEAERKSKEAEKEAAEDEETV